ncbi:SDR family NAD(P)-dependent oxidoreductase [Nocardia otitidiscaviarum]|uniref:SDR family NAD(P)-dependent oxidoreductase n=1 Tax=Nocardia otitidiscaviarum TaxID=1823 RepID=A0A516NKN0_9NOCA|nr:SDR family NAD(P)-dependent oxidoreductase [Nocardia otitidiscaviarum]MBF6180527.1 SDR family NAD(P)-dependent oxidoreductase [Nocardia otitidiscaviarum]MCP9623623.1 SDR family NAD(P)-dependent oxidoreductase [Nocardia otitidiscaviarum]QDP79457.1 SDR family NAD(P)-dependent oxidoreductase [Nocardia otitidiscaviarum]
MKTILITGATSGIGLAAARQLGSQGHHLVLVGRNPEKLSATAASVRECGAGAVDTLECDMGSLAQVRRLAKTVQANYSRLDVLANNAGGFHLRRTETEDGFETTFAVNHLAGFLLTELLMDLLLHSSPARILFTSSVMHYGSQVKLDDLGLRRGYTGARAYGASKLANILYVRDLERRLRGTGVTANAFHPGAVATHIWDEAPWFVKPAMELVKRIFMITPEQGAEALTYLATDPDVAAVSGCYFQRNRVKAPSRAAQDDAMARELYRVCAELAGLPD